MVFKGCEYRGQSLKVSKYTQNSFNGLDKEEEEEVRSS